MTGFTVEDFSETAELLRYGSEMQVKAMLSNRLNVILAALDIAALDVAIADAQAIRGEGRVTARSTARDATGSDRGDLSRHIDRNLDLGIVSSDLLADHPHEAIASDRTAKKDQ